MYSALKQMGQERYLEEELTVGWECPGPEYNDITKERAQELLSICFPVVHHLNAFVL